MDMVYQDPDDVKVAQRMLSLLDYGVLEDSGVLDAKTRQAVRAARADLGLPPSDLVDKTLLDALAREQVTRGPRRLAIGFGIAVAVLGVGAYFYSRRS